MFSKTRVEAVTSIKTDSIRSSDFIKIFEVFRATVLIRMFYFSVASLIGQFAIIHM